MRLLGQKYTDIEVARAADLCIIIAGNIVPEEYLREEPYYNAIPTFEVDYIVESLYNAHPTGMYGFYDVDGDLIRSFYNSSATQEDFDSFLKEWVYELDHYSYLNKLGGKRLSNIKTNHIKGFSTNLKRGSKK